MNDPTVTDATREALEKRAAEATEQKFALRLSSEDQRNGYEVGYFDALVAMEAKPDPEGDDIRNLARVGREHLQAMTELNDANLLPCPFCGGDGAMGDLCDDGYAMVVCVCTAQGPLRNGEPEAIAAWNTRHAARPDTNGDAKLTADDDVIDDLLKCFAEYGDHDRAAMAMVLNNRFASGLERPESWQPIATAPKDGTPFLAYCIERPPFAPAPTYSSQIAKWGISCFMSTTGAVPTHWRPLPPPPEGAG